MTIVSSSFWNDSQITIARTVDDLVTIIQEKRSQVKFIRQGLNAIATIIFIGMEREGS